MLDWEQIKTLQDQVGAEDFDEIVELFLEETQEIIDRLKASITPNTLEEELHFLKGSALNLGFRALSNLCQVGEAQSAQGNAQEVALDPVITCYETSKEVFLRDMKSTLG